MDRVYQSSAVESPPEPVASSGSFPTSGSKITGQSATVPGAYWFYSVTEEIRNAIIAAGVTPESAKVNQLAEALGKFLPLSGGTMNDVITFSGIVALARTDDASYIQINGGSGWGHGASLHLMGKDGSEKGLFNLTAHDGLNQQLLVGSPTGSLTWGGNSLALKPDFSSLTWISGLPWTAPVDCFVMISAARASNSSDWGCITVNGNEVLPFQNVQGMMLGDVTTQFWVKKGDVVGVSRNASLFRGCYCGGRF